MSLSPSTAPAVLVVFSHLRWGFVYQRPQHLLSRLAASWPVLFIEEPVFTDGPAHLESHSPCRGVTVLVPRTPVPAPGFHDDQVPVLAPLLIDYLGCRQLAEPVCFLYTPMALPLVAPLKPRCVVYDCMDELAAFKDAPRQLKQREHALFKRAAVVFTGGPSLYEAKRGQHANLHCIPSSVDAAHFSPARLNRDSPEARHADQLQGALPHPRLGFFGVIDERLDIELIGMIARRHPEWQIVMVGPIVKIDPALLPACPNLHWLGMQRYEVLPHLLSQWDLCLVPFARNESTRFISPTKTLEYMAGEKPVVSTAIHDVQVLYGESVAIADDAPGFLQACERLLAESDVEREQRLRAMRNTLQHGSWDSSAGRVRSLIETALQEAQPAVTDPAPGTSPVPAIDSAFGVPTPLTDPAVDVAATARRA